MEFSNIALYLWLSFAVLGIGSIYLIIEGYKVQKLFADSIVGKMVKILVVVLLIQFYSSAIISFAFLTFYPKGTVVLLPIVLLWLISLGFAIAGVNSAKREVNRLMK